MSNVVKEFNATRKYLYICIYYWVCVFYPTYSYKCSLRVVGECGGLPNAFSLWPTLESIIRNRIFCILMASFALSLRGKLWLILIYSLNICNIFHLHLNLFVFDAGNFSVLHMTCLWS